MNWSRWWPVGLVVIIVAVGVAPAQAQQSISEARDEPLGTEVTVEGTVTRAYGAYARIQDESGPTGASAIVIRQTSGSNSMVFQDAIEAGEIQPGTTLEVTGSTSAFNGIIQINNDDLGSFEVKAQGEPPSPQTVTLEDLSQNGEEYESELLRIEGLRFVSASGTFANGTTYTVEDGEGRTREFRVQNDDETEIGGTSIPGGVFAFEGVLGQFNGGGAGADEPDEGYQVIPVRKSDLQSSLSFSFNRLFARTEEGGGSVSVQVQVFNKETDEDISVTAEVGPASTAKNGTDVTGFDSPQTLTFSGTDPEPKTLTLDPVDDSEQEGVERLEVVLSTDDGDVSSPNRFTLWILDNPTAQSPLVAGDSNEVLLDSLRQRYGNPPTLGYDAARDSLYRSILNEQGTVETIYGGFQATADPDGDATTQLLDQDVNTEHLWPRSKGAEEEPALSNMYILAPAWSEANSYRCNYPYTEIDDSNAERWIRAKMVQSESPSTERGTYTESVGNTCGSPSDDGQFEPRHSRKGDVARAAFYFAMAYPNRADLSFLETQRETLLEWHREDPVDATELRRSLAKASYQGNRVNPFILDSTLAERAYEEGVPGPGMVAIADAREQGAGQTVTVEGVVTRVGPEGPYLQDDTGALYVFETSGSFGQNLGGTIREGTRLEVTGTLEFYNGLLELTGVAENGYEVLSQDSPLPEAPTLTLGEIAQGGDAYESALVQVEGFAIEAGGDKQFQEDTNYPISDGSGELVLRVPKGADLAGADIPDRATFQGVLGQFNDAGVGADEPDEGYQLLGLAPDDLEAELSGETTVDVTRSFGDPSTVDSYRLVALPGQVDQALASTLSGEAGVGWQAYWDDGSDQDPFIKFDGGDQFDFRPGRGFWVLSTSDWSVETTIPTVNVQNGETKIPLHDGWNIISNPLPRNVQWSAVQSANEGTLRALQAWDGSSFQETSTFVSAVEGEAFYFLNDQELEQLAIPLSSSEGTITNVATESRATRTVELVAKRKGRATARVEVGEHPAAADGKDGQDLVAPPSRFADLSLSVRAPFADAVPERQDQLARDVRPTGTPGQTYTLALRADTTGPVTLRAASLPQSPQVDVSLVDPATGRSHDLRTDGPMTLTAGPDPSRIQLLVGRSSYVASEADERLPESLTVQAPAPNPFRNQITLKYALPEAQDVTVAVFDLLGRRVRTLVEGRQEAGPHRVSWDGMNASQRQLASGAYFLRVSTDEKQHVEKVVLVR
ncbi:endonuclease [Salinibacter ruber]|uniref:endonuclease n=1 Tax=Salinibacter ruber TaxID=146919 RepID=UPI002166E43C|nr:endonuclease [Salinibacter ruber]MCS3784238.1 endonuclease I [Salinibacter ruber]